MARAEKFMARAQAHAEGINIQCIDREIRRSPFVFVANRDIPPANTSAGRTQGVALRAYTVFRKNAQQFSHRLGHQTLRPHSLRHRDRSPLRAIGALEDIRLTKAQSSVPQSCVNFLDFGINPWYKI